MNQQVKVAKNLAKHLTAALSKDGQEMSHGAALEVVAKAMGARNWHAFLAEQQATPVAATIPSWSPAHGPMSNEQYACSQAEACPVCGCPHKMESAAFEADGNRAWREVGCHSCSSVWNENFSLTGWNLVKRHDGTTTPQGAADTGFLYAVRLWLFSVDNDDRQMEIDDLVIDRAHGTSRLNSAVSVADQENVLEDSESRASDINNQGIIAQLQYLLDTSESRDEFLDTLAEQCDVSRDTLKL